MNEATIQADPVASSAVRGAGMSRDGQNARRLGANVPELDSTSPDRPGPRPMKDSCAAVLRFLRVRGKDGATEAEIQSATGIRSGAQRIHELIHLYGFRIEKVMERSEAGARFARWFLVETPTFAPTTGVQEALSL